MLEIPLTVLEWGRVRVPVLGGGYLRHYPLNLNMWALKKIERSGRSAVVYMHPYELDDSPRGRRLPLAVSEEEARAMAQFARGQFRNRRRSENKLRDLLARARFAPLREVFAPELETASRTESRIGRYGH